jgi:acyloxyacyl hydrolase
MKTNPSDCNDSNSNIHPGRKFTESSQVSDYNCNGIHGVNPQGIPSKKEFCDQSQQRGVIAVGDSACAHFRIPENLFNASSWNSNTFNEVYSLLETELDFPQYSWVTGFQQLDQCLNFFLIFQLKK